MDLLWSCKTNLVSSAQSFNVFIVLNSLFSAGPNACLALEQLKQAMLCNAGYKKFFEIGFIGNPTIRIVPHGTFNAYRGWYVGKSGFNPAQVKVPCAIVDPEVRQFLADRVTIDLELKYGIS